MIKIPLHRAGERLDKLLEAPNWPWMTRLADRIGRRGAFLILFGFIYLEIGYTLATQTVTPLTHEQLKIALEVAPLWVYGVGWMIAGVLMMMIGSSVPRRFVLDNWGFIVGSVCPSVWATVWLTAWIDGDASGRSWILYAAFAVAVLVVAGMPNPPRPGVHPGVTA